MRRALVVLIVVVAVRGAAADPSRDRATAKRERDACAQALAEKNFADAESACKRAIAAWDGDALAWYLLGSVERARKDRHAAVDAYEHAARLHPDEPMYLMWLGVARYDAVADDVRSDQAKRLNRSDLSDRDVDLSRANLDPAREMLEKAVAIAPALWRAHFYLGRIALAHDDPRAAADQLSRAILANPAYTASYVALANLYLRAGYLDQAIQVAMQGTSNAPAQEQLELWQLLGLAWSLRGDHDHAIEAYGHVLDIDPAIVSAHFGRGLAEAHKGDRSAAQTDLELVLAPDARPHASSYMRVRARQTLRALGTPSR